ncbi:MAG: DUF1508 domain-containing protein [Solirubrobacterales bacterium]|nr:DUF1508 domain-containing protein [Solirubrobacterales bacterium]
MYFAIRRSKDGQYWWRAVGDNNEIMAASELMTTKQSCQHAIDVIRAQAAAAPVHDQSGEEFAPGHHRGHHRRAA